jgi:IPT/TIG domain
MRSTNLFARPVVCAFCVVGFALALSLGCGTNTHDQKATFGTSFTPPALNAIDPATVPVNSTPFVMTLKGHNFGRDAIVFWHNVPHTARFVSSTELQVSVTADDLTIFGLVQVYVQTGGMTSNTVDFDVTAN